MEKVKTPDTPHECCVCGKSFSWNDDCSWYGSWSDFEAGKSIDKFCSTKCREEYCEDKKIKDEFKDI